MAKITKDKFQKLLDKTLRFISLRPRSEKEIREYLRKKKSTPKLIENVVQKLKFLNQIDDFQFAQWWVEQRATFRPKGKIALVMELRQKGVEKEIIDNVVGGKGVDELALARRVVEKKLKVCQNLSPLEFRQKIAAFLSRRGFSWETIKSVIDEFSQK